MSADTPSQQTLHEIIQQHGIDVPVMRTRLVGSRIELYLYGGRCIVHDSGTGLQPPPATELKDMKLAELHQLAKARGLKRYSRLSKAALVELLRVVSQAQDMG